MLRFVVILSLIALSCVLNESSLGALEDSKASGSIDFNRDIRPILSNKCFVCHGPDGGSRKGGSKKLGRLRLDNFAGATLDHEDMLAIVPGKPEESELILRVTELDDEEVMPPKKKSKRLTKREVDLLKQWIKEGAKYAKHWSYEKIVRRDLPKVKNKKWARNEIDTFILKSLEEKSWGTSKEASNETLIRRLSLDLTGLPPTIEEVENFLSDKSSKAYENLVDRLIAKKAYGEHWARPWLDLARYADSMGYTSDNFRSIWLYRDWVITAINDNMAFDQFSIEQLAGDLLEKPSEAQIIATGFHRNTKNNDEGGTDNEEFRIAAVKDRVITSMQTWMGSTAECSQCHDHKYDPISQKDFYSMFAIFNNTEDADRNNESPFIHKKVKGKKVKTLIMKEITEAKKRRKSFVHVRGNFKSKGEQVKEGVSEELFAFPKDLKKDRLGYAKWLIHKDNPLTPRVIANRYWELLFGIGLVSTSEEFGSQGEQPSHPELLDWLASELLRLNWDVKKYIKIIVMSATYRQSAAVTGDYQKDPQNRFLSRGPRFRMSAEMIRDQALFVSGLLSETMYGPSVRPPQPKTNLRAAFGGSIDWKDDTGENRYRRGLYTTWRRIMHYPSMATFDAPSRTVCRVRRLRTNTPLQALVILNDPVYWEASQALGRRVLTEKAKASLEEKITFAFRLCLARKPNKKENEILKALYEKIKVKVSKKDKGELLKMASQPLGKLPEGMDVKKAAIWTLMANSLLNLDEMMMKR